MRKRTGQVLGISRQYLFAERHGETSARYNQNPINKFAADLNLDTFSSINVSTLKEPSDCG